METTATIPAKIILGSSSIARRNILSEMGYEFTVITADIDEKSIRKEKPEDLVMALAEAKLTLYAFFLVWLLIANGASSPSDAIYGRKLHCLWLKTFFPLLLCCMDMKAEAILQKLPVGDYEKDVEPALLITCDQVVVYEGAVREKPSSEEEARQYIKGYSGGHAATVSSVLVTNLKTGFRKVEFDRVEIYFHEILDEVIDKLIEEGLVLRVAGGLIIEHPLIVPYVKEVVGTTDSVMGLPKALTEKLLKEAL